MGKRISSRRKQLGLTQNKLSEASGILPQTISTAKRGEKVLRPANIAKICAALGGSVDYLLTGKSTDINRSILVQKLSCLSPEQYRHLEIIIDSFIAVATQSENKA